MKTLIAIMTCPRYLDRRNAVRDTWMPFVERLNTDVDVKFFTGKEPCLVDDGAGDIIHLDCPDTYDLLPQKTHALVTHAFKNGYDRLIKVDDDTYLMPLPEFIAELTKHQYFGSVRFNPGVYNDNVNYAQGGCYVLDRFAMQAIVLQKDLFQAPGIEDGRVAKALSVIGIFPTHSDRIKTVYQHGIPRADNDIISAHAAPPDKMREIHDQNTLRLLAAYNAELNKNSKPEQQIQQIPNYVSLPSIKMAPLPCVTTHDDSITVVITSCGRFDLLKRTLTSLGKTQIDAPIKETIIINDGPEPMPDWLLEFRVFGLGELKWISNGKRQGQWISIDRAYDQVTTEYIFHCEDDWEFDGRPFLAESMKLLKEYPQVLQVSIRGNDNTSGHPNVYACLSVSPIEIQQPYWRGCWGGFSGNPGLRRKSDWQRIGSYGRFTGYGQGGIAPEQIISKLYLDLGYRIAVLPTDKPFVKHIGERRSVAIDKLKPKPRVLIAVPACHKYAYGNHANDLKPGITRHTEGRIEAVRSTWWNDINPFSDYVDAKFFYGTAPAGMNRKPEADEVFLNVPDDYEHLPQKMQAIYAWALKNGYDYVFKADDDGYLYVDRLMRIDYEKWDQIGFSNCTHGLGSKCGCYITGGAGYFLSKRALQALVGTPLNTGSPHKWAEDWQTGQVLRAKNMRRTGHPGFLPGFDKHFVNVDEVAANDKIVACHAVTPEGMHTLYGK